ncbi:MAG: hypothetical protein ACREUT_14060 [Steroidobacteraceae bacterium]
MRIVWVLTVLHLVAGGTGSETDSTKTVQMQAPRSHELQTKRITVGLYASKAACRRMRDQLLHAPGFIAGSAQCVKELN